MSFASGFFNSVDHDRLYDATDISRLFDGLIRDGIFASIGDCLVVKQSNKMNVTVGTGRAWFNHTWSYNDALYPVTIPPSEILMDRIDAIVLEINSVESVRANSIKLIKGTPASTPTKPALTNTKEVHQYPLAYVKVGKEVTSIRQADIENCVGTSACPFVTGILEVISIEQLIPQWRDILNRFVEENTANFNTWMNGEKQDYQAWLMAAKKEITDWQATSKSDYQKWYDSIKNGYDQWFATIKAAYDANWSTFQQWEKASQTEFDKWFENMKNKLEGDLGAKLTLETEKLGKEKVSLIESTKTDLEGTVEAPLMIGKATRNLLNPTLQTSTSNGITCTNNGDGTYTLNGTATGRAIFAVCGENFYALSYFVGDAKIVKQIFSEQSIPGSNDNYAQGYYFAMQGKDQLDNLYIDEIVVDDYDNNKYRPIINVATGRTVDNVVIKPMLTTDLNATNDDFVPYSGYDIKTIGKNLLNPTLLTTTQNGITCTNNGDGTYTLNGTATKGVNLYIAGSPTKNTVGGCKLLGCPINGSKDTYRIVVSYYDNSEWKAEGSDIGNGVIIDGTYSRINYLIKVESGTTVTNLVFKPMLTTDLNATYDDFVPYQDGGSVHIDSSTEFPNFDLKTFDGATHIISPSNVQSFHADAPNGKYLLESIKKSAESGGVSYGATEPTNPKPGDLWVNPNKTNVLYVYTGKYWYVTNSLYIGDNGGFPSSPYVGQLVYHPNSKMMYVNIPYGGSFGGPGWYPVGSDDPGGYYYGSSAPSNTKLLWIDNSGVARFYNGSAWIPLAATWG